MIKFIIMLDKLVNKTLTAFCAIFLLLMVVFAVYNVVMRYVFENPPVWGDLLTVLSNIWLVFLALALTVRDKDHIALDLIYTRLPLKAVFAVQQFWTLVIFCLGTIMIIYGIEAVDTMGGKYWEMCTSLGKTESSFSSLTTCRKNTPSLSYRYQVFWFALLLSHLSLKTVLNCEQEPTNRRIMLDWRPTLDAQLYVRYS